MKKKLKTPTLVTTAVLTLITVIFWVAFEVYRTLTTKPAPVVPAEIIAPLNPTLDEATLNKLKLRINLSDDEVGNLVAGTPVPVATEIPTPVASESATPVASQSATTPTPSP